jgi:hypothetical protein
MKRNLLFVTTRDSDFGQDLSYALELAKMTDRGMAILLVNRKRLADSFEKIMTAVTFAEAGEHETARSIIEEDTSDTKNALTLKLKERCLQSGIATSVYSALRDSGASIKEFVKQHSNIDMVLLSPSIAGNGSLSPKELKMLVKTVSRPVVTMANHAAAS